MSESLGCLWVVATPIGNLSDLSQRAKAILEEVEVILCEDTRRSQHLMTALQISPRKLISFHEHNEAQREPWVLAELQKGQDLALISDAGTPLMADPGYRLVRACRKQGIKVSPIPGPSAPLAALSACGLPPLPYTFLGFLPRDASSQVKLFQTFAEIPTTLVAFERSDRLKASLKCALEILGAREIAICRELTKIYEEFKILNLEDYASLDLTLLGEITLVIGPPLEKTKTAKAKVLQLMQPYLDNNCPTRKIIHSLQESLQGWSSKDLYNLIEMQKNKDV